jgi:antitoxin ParD1/3/4
MLASDKEAGMARVVKRTFSLTEEQAAFIDEKVKLGGFASGSEVIRQSLRGFQDEDAAIGRWLREEVVPTLEEYEADPSRARPIDEVFSELLAEFEEDDRKREAETGPERRSA